MLNKYEYEIIKFYRIWKMKLINALKYEYLIDKHTNWKM